MTAALTAFGTKSVTPRTPKKHTVIVDEAASTFARRVLGERAARVGRLLRLAAKRGDSKPAHVHQLRVATRRTLAALETFAALIPRRRAKKLRRSLRRIRRAAGAARDADVLVPHVKSRGEGLSRKLFTELSQRLSHDCAAAHDALRKAFGKRQRQRWKTTVRRCLKKVGWRGNARKPPTATELLERAGSKLMQDLRQFAVVGPADVKAIHALRLKIKRLRYVLELCNLSVPAKRVERSSHDGYAVRPGHVRRALGNGHGAKERDGVDAGCVVDRGA